MVRKQVSDIVPGAIANSTFQQIDAPGVLTKTGNYTTSFITFKT